MEPRTLHGNLYPKGLAQALIAEFNRGNLRAQMMGDDERIVVQIATHERARSGGPTALTVNIQKAEDGVVVSIGKQNWLGTAASLGQSAFTLWRNPLALLDRLDDIAQDIENLQLSERAWEAIEKYARSVGASFELSERLRRLVCAYCKTANPVGEASCLACGAPLGEEQPTTCKMCGFVLRSNEPVCPNCGAKRSAEFRGL